MVFSRIAIGAISGQSTLGNSRVTLLVWPAVATASPPRGQGLTTREATRPRIDGENRTKRLGMLVALPGHQATAGLSSE